MVAFVYIEVHILKLNPAVVLSIAAHTIRKNSSISILVQSVPPATCCGFLCLLTSFSFFGQYCFALLLLIVSCSSFRQFQSRLVSQSVSLAFNAQTATRTSIKTFLHFHTCHSGSMCLNAVLLHTFFSPQEAAYMSERRYLTTIAYSCPKNRTI